MIFYDYVLLDNLHIKFIILNINNDLKVNTCQLNLYVMLQQLYFYNFYDFFLRRHSLMNRTSCNNLLQIRNATTYET